MQEKKNAILRNVNQASAREGWVEQGGPPKSRPQWSQQAHLDSAMLNRHSIMNDSSMSDLSVQGQAMNLATPNTPVRPQWGGAPRGTILNVLEHANVYDHTLTSTAGTDASGIGLSALARRVNPNSKNETNVVITPKPAAASSAVVEKKPVATDLVVEDFNGTFTIRPNQNTNAK